MKQVIFSSFLIIFMIAFTVKSRSQDAEPGEGFLTDSLIIYLPDGSDTVPCAKFLFYYNEKYLESEVFTYMWDTENDQWQIQSHALIEYDEFNRMLNSVGYNWYNAWVRTGTAEFYYASDTARNPYLEIINTDETGTDLVPYSKNELAYNSNDDFISCHHYLWDEDDWRYTGFDTLTFDTNYNCTSHAGYNWDTLANEYVPAGETLYEYDGEARVLHQFNYIWQLDSSSMFLMGRWDYTYFEDGSSSRTYFDFCPGSMGQTGISDGKEEPVPESREDKKYDQHRNLKKHVSLSWESDDWSMTSMVRYYYHSMIPSTVQTQPGDDLKIWPNPTTGVINIAGDNITEVAVYSTAGILLSTFPANGYIDLSAFPRGIYMLRLVAGSDSETRMVVVR